MSHEDARLGEMVSPYDRPDPPDEGNGILDDPFFGQLSGAFVYSLSTLAKGGLEVWISGVYLLIASGAALLLWITFVSPAILRLGSASAELDRGWSRMWQRLNLFVGGTIGLVVVQTANEMFLRGWQEQGAAPHEALLELTTLLLVFFGVVYLLQRVPGARAGRRTL